MSAAATAEVRQILAALGRLPGEDPPEVWWSYFTPAEWPALFRLLGVAADLPRLAGSAVLADLPAELWPELCRVVEGLVHLQRLVDHPVVPPDATPASIHSLAELERAKAELEQDRCTTVDFLLDPPRQGELETLVAELARDRLGTWGQLERAECPPLFELADAALGGDRFRRLTGFDPERDEYTLTLSLQDLEPAGIGWHRDLYWPREWLGADVFAVLYALSDDSPEKGGAFLHYVPEGNALRAVYRQRHQATVVWNCRKSEERPLHAVAGFHGEDRSRHMIILQCLRRQEPGPPGPRSAMPGDRG